MPPVPLAAGPAQPGRLVWLAAPLRRRREAVVSPWRPAQPGKQVRLLAAVSLRRLAPRDCWCRGRRWWHPAGQHRTS